MSRFGASKFRNAQLSTPPREEWYRGNLPTTGSSTSTSSSTSTFSSEVKANRTWLVTVTAGGQVSWRRQGESESQATNFGPVGDWDLSRLEDGILAIGGTDGTIKTFQLSEQSPTSLQPLSTFPGKSPITHISLHPTTPSILLASSPSTPAAIFDLSSGPVPIISLNAKEPKGLWTASWSPDGRLIAGVGRSGTGYIWDPRSSTEPITSKTLPLQPLKPTRITWIGSDIFLTAFDRSRNRFYALLSGKDLSTVFTQNVDTNTAPLLAQIDQERRIVYVAGRGDMTLRQIELSGPMGYQETLHSLPFPLASASLAIADPTTLPVMQAQIATLLLPVVDKDGDAIVPFGIKVPRRQLIDYHDDLYPEVMGTVPEQTSTQWFKGDDATPLQISLDPSKRQVWEARLAQAPASAQTPPTPQVPAATDTSSASKSVVADSTLGPNASASLSVPAPPPAGSSSPSSTTATASSLPTSPSHPSLPPLQDGETHSSTSYKVRIIADHIAEQHKLHRTNGSTAPLFVGLQGPQGCGKTTLCDTLVARLKETFGLSTAVLSLDDLYLPNHGLKDLAKRHPDNKLLAGRGPPGTHDGELAHSVLDAVRDINDEAAKVALPIFDKSLCGGEGDRSTDTIQVNGPLDIFFLEGWSMGFSPLSNDELEAVYKTQEIPFTSSKNKYFTSHSLDSLLQLNTYLSDFSTIYEPFTCMIQVEPDDYEHVFKWRLQQEHAMKAKNGGKGMTDEQVRVFVERYMPGYELWREGIWGDRPWSGRGLRLFYGSEREVVKVEKPEAKKPTSSPGAQEPVIPERVTTSASSSDPITAAHDRDPVTTEPKPKKDGLSTDQKDAPGSANKTASSGKPSTPYNPNWSRKFLAAKSPLIPTYDSLPPLSSLHQDSIVFKINRDLAFFPVQGPGGRLGVHPLRKKGRMTTGGEGYLSNGGEIAAFDVEIAEQRVAIAGEDGLIRVWQVDADGVQGVGPEPSLILKGQGIDKIAQVAFHPTAKDLLSAITNDHGKASLRFWDLSAGEEARCIALDSDGVFNFTWAPEGDRVALSTKDGRLVTLDPRQPDKLIHGPAHDSPRSFQIAWIDKQRLVSVGFSRGSQRKINLYEIKDDASIQTLSSLLIDVSPSVLFPHYDPDTSILYIWGKGERQIQAYQIQLDHANEPIAKLPSYTAGTPQLGVAWFPKRMVDVRKVEVGKALRLNAKSIEEVSFSIPRNKPEFFQDDIYGETIDVESYTTTAKEWLSGSNVLPTRVSLRPEGMTLLSQAPKTTSASTRKFIPASDILSEEEKKRREMDQLFAKAKLDESSDEEDAVKKGLDPPDDDW